MKILLCAKSLESGGVEVSLINLIDRLLLDDNEITLLLLNNYGQYKGSFDRRVKVICVPFKNNKYNFYRKRSQRKGIKDLACFVYQRLICKVFGFQVLYRSMNKYIEPISGEFDVAIDYHGYGYYGSIYVLDYVKAKKKIMFIHDEKMDWMKRIGCRLYDFDALFCVSKSCAKIVCERFGCNKNKVVIFKNILNKAKIIGMSKEKIAWKYSGEKVLLTIGRLEYQKGYDMLIGAAKKLKEDGIKFKWLIIGTGSEKDILEKEIRKKELEDNIYLLGFIKNPYPYIKKADIYVQTSRHEGYGIAIAEARILCKPIISTDIECVKEHIKDNVNGYIVSKDPINICNKIEMLLEDNKKINKVINELKSELKTSSIDSVSQIYNLLVV